jgi:hypothetical protein
VARAPQSLPNLARIAKGLGDVREILDGLAEKADRAESKSERVSARVDKVETAQDEHARALTRLDNRSQEILATQTNSYREFTTLLAGFKADLQRIESMVSTASDIAAQTGPEAVAKAAEGGASGVIKATQSSALGQILKSRAAQAVAASAGFIAIVSAVKNMPDALRAVGQFWLWAISQHPKV